MLFLHSVCFFGTVGMKFFISKKAYGMKERKQVIRYEVSPFHENLVVKKRNKVVSVSPMGKGDNILINQHTGEIQGTAVTTYRSVDDATFVKLFSQNIALSFDLSSAGIKALNVVIYAVQYTAINKDEVFLDSQTLQKFFSDNTTVKTISMRTFLNGLSDLESAKIIAKSKRQGIYFINPNFIFNGDRIAFTTMIERKKKTRQEILEENGQQRLLM